MTSRLEHVGSGSIVAERVTWARTWRERVRGLIGRELGPGAALVIASSQIHTFFMTVPIDAVFCDKEWRVVYVAHRLRPYRVTRWVRDARYVVELPAGAARSLAAGDRLALV